MYNKKLQELYKELIVVLTDKQFLKKLKLSKTSMLKILKEDDWRENIRLITDKQTFSCADILAVCEKTIRTLAPASAQDRPGFSYLDYTYRVIETALFPENPTIEKNLRVESGRLFFLAVLRFFLAYEQTVCPFDPKLDLSFLDEEEIQELPSGREYRTLLKLYKDSYLYEFMRIGSEIKPFNLLAHIAGVHYIAMHVARQLNTGNVPVDLALVSGAALGHDIGKFGCRGDDEKRIPYLHYYYTEQFLKKHHMPTIAHIAANHSTWDLELENLSAESLLLIYADFRVKSKQSPQGEEVIFYSLQDSFDVILHKLDNVDEAKKERYMRVYAKLKEFEAYMQALGVNTDLTMLAGTVPPKKDAALLSSREAVETLMHLAIEHNILVMHKLSREASFANILEAARSEKDWKNIRAYINIFEEYFTYMTQKQKLLTLNFLQELLMHREGDIRRQAADLIGNIIVNYDEEYRKEIPPGKKTEPSETTGFDLWEKYLSATVHPDHKVTDQHKRWRGYTLKLVVGSVFKRCKEEDRIKYTEPLLHYYTDTAIDDSTAFILLDSMNVIPPDLCDRETLLILMTFADKMSARKPPEIQIAVLRFVKYVSENISLASCGELPDKGGPLDKIEKIYSKIDPCASHAGKYLQERIALTLAPYSEKLRACAGGLPGQHDFSSIFPEDLKTATPWVVKEVNIDLLLRSLNPEDKAQILQVAAHFSNLIKVSERVAVRHRAGEGLLEIADKLSPEQRNEVVIELTKGLEIGEYEFSKYIPEYLGELALYLHPNELDEFIDHLGYLLESRNERVCSVSLNTLGVLIQCYPQYQNRFREPLDRYEARKKGMLGIILKGLSNYDELVSQEALLVIGKNIFGSGKLSMAEKYAIFEILCKKMLTLIVDQKETDLSFYNRAASLNHIYRFISDSLFLYGDFKPTDIDKVAFFPGTFDPFSLSHKSIVNEIRDMGFEVYLALDEFSWSKRTQPRMVRRKIISMSIADQRDVYLFPDNIPVNIANPGDLKALRELFPQREISIVVGSDVVEGASSYKAEPVETSIHSFDHIIFKRSAAKDSEVAAEDKDKQTPPAYQAIKGKVSELSLPVHMEDISSTRIRENIDLNRDISTLIDPLAQNYIYDNSLYLRESQYKQILKSRGVAFHLHEKIDAQTIEEVSDAFLKNNPNRDALREYLKKRKTRILLIKDETQNRLTIGFAAFHEISVSDIYDEFLNIGLAEYIRKKSCGKIIVLSGMILVSKYDTPALRQQAITEILAYCLSEDFTYALYHNKTGKDNPVELGILLRQGFVRLKQTADEDPIYAVDMKYPLTVFKDMETIIKEPFNTNEKVLHVLQEAHEKFQTALTKLYPGRLVLSFDSVAMYDRISDLVTAANRVPSEPLKVRNLGDSMCVPFGKILRGMIVANTVTKSLHTEKCFDPEIRRFTIREFPFYAPLENQIKTIKSFNRPVFLVDDLLHKGYRIKELDPLFKKEGVNISKLVVGVLSGTGKDLMTLQERDVESVYYIPRLKAWFSESSMYPFIGGDSVDREDEYKAGLIPSINLILPYVAPNFLSDTDNGALYEFSMTCLENAKNIISVLEEEYRQVFERNLTLNRLGEAVFSPRCPDNGIFMRYDCNFPPSVYIKNDIEKLVRLKNLVL